MRRLAILLLALSLGACVRRTGDGASARVEHLTVGGAAFRLVYLDEDARTAEEMKGILADAVPRTQRWGELRRVVTVTIHPTHEALEAAVHREGYEWLRAWAKYGSIDLQSPRTWSLLGPSRAQVLELVVHELTHCVMYQNASTDWSWPYKGIPLWFREGLASVTADQGYRRPGPEAVARFYRAPMPGAGDGVGGGGGGTGGRRRARDGDPLTDPDPLYQADSDLVYGTAHLAFEFLLRRYGEERVRDVLARMQSGEAFPAAFAEGVGVSAEEFERDFRRYLVWEGWAKRR